MVTDKQVKKLFKYRGGMGMEKTDMAEKTCIILS